MTPGHGTRFLALVLAGTAVACGGLRTVEIPSPVDLSWPADDPRIRLESLIDLERTRSRGSARILRWIGGKEQAPSFLRPYGLAWDGQDLLVADPDGARVARISPGGRTVLSPEGVFVHPVGIASCPQGIIVTDSVAGGVAVLDAELGLSGWLAEGLSRPTAVGCDGERVFVVETGGHRIRVYEGGSELPSIGRRGDDPGQLNFPAAMTLDGATLWVGDTLNFRIQRLQIEDGQPVGEFGTLGDSPGETPRTKGVAVDAAGQVWVSDGILDTVSLYDRDGAFLVSIGGTGAGPGEFSFPAGIAAHPDGRIAVADSLNRRLQIFRLVDAEAAAGG